MNKMIATPEGTRDRLFAECAAFRRVERFGGWEFEAPAGCGLLVLHAGEAGAREILARSGAYVVCKGDGP